MSTGIELAKQGKCGICEEAVERGPWTDEQIAEAVQDTGFEAFEDWCDQCLVTLCFDGDAKYAAKLLGRPVKAGFAALLGVRHG